MSEIEPCHSCENRNPGSWLYFWIPASAGMTIFNASNIESLNLGLDGQKQTMKWCVVILTFLFVAPTVLAGDYRLTVA